jgi:hypothetical protein
VTGAIAPAAIRRRIPIPLRFGDGYSTMAAVVSFTGPANASPVTYSAASGATAGRA